MKLVFATNNAHKLEEIKEMLGTRHEIVSLKRFNAMRIFRKNKTRSKEMPFKKPGIFTQNTAWTVSRTILG